MGLPLHNKANYMVINPIVINSLIKKKPFAKQILNQRFTICSYLISIYIVDYILIAANTLPFLYSTLFYYNNIIILTNYIIVNIIRKSRDISSRDLLKDKCTHILPEAIKHLGF